MAALRCAAEKGDINELQKRLEVNEDTLRTLINAQDPETDLTPLALAASSGHCQCVSALLAKRADPNVVIEDAGNRTALHMAAYDAHVEVVEMLLEARADANATCTAGTAKDIVLQRAKEWRVGGGDGEEDIDRLQKVLVSGDFADLIGDCAG
eukprot:symbB.v1.2.011272.t1/scaffold753.1/size277516/8